MLLMSVIHALMAGPRSESGMTLNTIDREATASLEVKGSRFLAHILPLAAFEGRLEALRIEHRKASHFVTAVRAVEANGQITERARDDGEPGGTAGMPILRVLIGAELVEVGCVVIRYFGGTKLGTGGLARAYSGAAALAVETATIRRWARTGTRIVAADFAQISVLEQAVDALPVTILDRSFTENGVALTLEGAEEVLKDETLDKFGRTEAKTPT